MSRSWQGCMQEFCRGVSTAELSRAIARLPRGMWGHAPPGKILYLSALGSILLHSNNVRL